MISIQTEPTVARPLSVHKFQGNKAYVLGFVILVTSIVIKFIFTNINTENVFHERVLQSQLSNNLKFLLDLVKMLLITNSAFNWVSFTEEVLLNKLTSAKKLFQLCG